MSSRGIRARTFRLPRLPRSAVSGLRLRLTRALALGSHTAVQARHIPEGIPHPGRGEVRWCEDERHGRIEGVTPLIVARCLGILDRQLFGRRGLVTCR